MSSSTQKGILIGLGSLGVLAIALTLLYLFTPGLLGLETGDPQTSRELEELKEAAESGQSPSQTAQQMIALLAKADIQKMTPEQRLALSEAMRNQIWSSEQGREAYRQAMQNLSEEEHDQLRDKRDELRRLAREDRQNVEPTPEQLAEREKRQQEMHDRLDEYFNSSEEKKKEILDERLDRMQQWREEREKRRAEREANMTEQERKAREERRAQREQENSDRPSRTERMVDHIKERIESSDPALRAKFTEFIADLRKRAEERGIEMGFGGGRGPR